jgi:hypothetical protein
VRKLTGFLHEVIWEYAFELVDSLECQIKAHMRAYLPFSCYMSEEDFRQMAYEAAYNAINTFLKKNTNKTKKEELVMSEINECKNIICAYFIVTYRRMCSEVIEYYNKDKQCVKFQEIDIDTVVDKCINTLEKMKNVKIIIN